MSDKQPTVSIGMPVYNGENYIAAALDSILAQSFSDFEVVISDNASTDHTEEICRNYQARDPRIRYYRNPKNLGAARNHNQVFTLSCGKYFKWASHDDILSPDFLARCVAVLEQDPSVVLCHSRIMVIDDFNKRTVPLQDAVGLGMSHSPAQRFGSVILHDRSCADIYGLIRSDILRKTSLIDLYVGSDRTLRAELALLGRFYEVPEYLFFNRDHAERSVRSMPAHHQRVAWFDPDRVGRKVFPHWRILLEYWRAIERAPLTSGQRFRCRLYLARWVSRYGNWARMAADVIIFIKPGLWRFLYELASSHDKNLVSLREQSTQSGGGSGYGGRPQDGRDLSDTSERTAPGHEA